MRILVVTCLLLALAVPALAEGVEDDPLDEGRSLLRTPRRDEGVAKLREVIRAYREGEPDALKLVWIGRAHFLLEENEKAIEAITAATRKDPENPWTHLWLGIVWKWVDPKKAVAPLEEAIRLRSDYEHPWYHLAIVLGRLDRDEEALKAILKALELGSDTASTHFHAGVQLLNAGRKKEALEHFERSADLDPNHAASRYNLGLAHYDAGEYEQALERFQQAAAIDTEDLMTHVQVLKALRALGREKEAVACRETIFALHAVLPEDERNEWTYFVCDRFMVDEMQVVVREYFAQDMNQLYIIRFRVTRKDGSEFTINLEPHAAHGRFSSAKYVLGRNEGKRHTTFRIEWKRRPPYPELKKAAIKAMKGKAGRASSSG